MTAATSLYRNCLTISLIPWTSQGEAILMIHDNAMEKRLAKHLMCGEIESLCSALHKGYGGGLEKLILELVCTGRIVDEEFVSLFVLLYCGLLVSCCVG